MLVQFSRPWFLLLGLTLPLIWYISSRGYAAVSSFRKKIVLILRLIILSFLILSLAGVKVRLPTNNETVFFLVDASESITAPNKELAKDFIENSLQGMRRGDRAGIIVFGREALIESLPQTHPHLSDLRTRVNPHQTNIEEALRLAMANFPRWGNKRVVLLSDGNETVGKAVSFLDSLKKERVRVDILPLIPSRKEEALLERMIIPERVRRGEKFKVKVIAQSFQESFGVLRLYCNGVLLGEEEVELKEGENLFVFWQSLEKKGFYTYKAVLDVWEDTITQNNEVSGYTVVEGKPKLLLLTDKAEDSFNLIHLLKDQGFELEVCSSSNAPSSINEMQDYDAIILDDVSAYDFSHRQMNLLARYVRDLGGGLLALGGNNSFGLGGYQGTALEEVLPVYSGAQERLVLPTLSLVLVIDKSGSMGGGGRKASDSSSKLFLAKKAALAVANLLTGYERIGILSFDTVPRWTVPLQSAADKASISRRLAALVAGGGTSLFPALKEAFDRLKEEKSVSKHVIVLSDGLSDKGEFEKLVKEMVNAKITVSTVAIGEDADRELMKNIARWGKGKAYYTEDVTTLPRIFTTEALRITRRLTVSESFVPSVKRDSPILSGIDWKNVPPLNGYVVTTAKKVSNVHLFSPRKDPLLVTWRYGLGRAAAFTCDLEGVWSKSWQDWPEYPKFLVNLINWVLPSGKGILFPLVRIKGTEGHIIVDAIDEEGNFVNFLSLQAKVVKPQDEEEVVLLSQTAPGRYEGTFSASEIGPYMISVFDEKGSFGPKVTGAVIPYSPEYRRLSPNEDLLVQLASETGGRILKPTDQVFGKSRFALSSPQEIWPLLVLLASLLLLADIALRTVSSHLWKLLLREAGLALKMGANLFLSLRSGSLKDYTRLVKEKKEAQREQWLSKVFKSQSEADKSYYKLLSYLAHRRRKEKDED